jgi:hypothetical protein
MSISQATQAAVLASLHPELALRMTRVLASLGGRLVMQSGHRPPAEQAKLYDRGRKVVWSADWRVMQEIVVDRAKIVTFARPMSSAHNFSPSRAVDCVLDTTVVEVTQREGRLDMWCTATCDAREAWADYGAAVRSEGLVWGGDWRMRDLPHAELPAFLDPRWR